MELIILLVLFVIFLILKSIFVPTQKPIYSYENKTPFFEEEHPESVEPTEDKKMDLKIKYGSLSVEEIVFSNEIKCNEKLFLLKEIYSYTYEEAWEVIKTAEREEKKAKLREIKSKISRKAQELYASIPVDDERKPIPDEVKMFVWNRDNGKCIKCGGRENLEFDHIIPVSKGGSNTARNIQLLCEKCNRSKRDNL